MLRGWGEVKPAGCRADPAGRGFASAPPSHYFPPARRSLARVITILFSLLGGLIRLYIWAVILAAVFSMLVSFGVLDTRNRLVWTIGDFLYRVTEPALRPIRRFLPNFGGIDISPMVLIILLWVLQAVLARVYAAVMFGDYRSLML